VFVCMRRVECPASLDSGEGRQSPSSQAPALPLECQGYSGGSAPTQVSGSQLSRSPQHGGLACVRAVLLTCIRCTYLCTHSRSTSNRKSAVRTSTTPMMSSLAEHNLAVCRVHRPPAAARRTGGKCGAQCTWLLAHTFKFHSPKRSEDAILGSFCSWPCKERNAGSPLPEARAQPVKRTCGRSRRWELKMPCNNSVRPWMQAPGIGSQRLEFLPNALTADQAEEFIKRSSLAESGLLSHFGLPHSVIPWHCEPQCGSWHSSCLSRRLLSAARTFKRLCSHRVGARM
jgi:hypothetical protein